MLHGPHPRGGRLQRSILLGGARSTASCVRPRRRDHLRRVLWASISVSAIACERAQAVRIHDHIIDMPSKTESLPATSHNRRACARAQTATAKSSESGAATFPSTNVRSQSSSWIRAQIRNALSRRPVMWSSINLRT
jgi:hypothetical protein